MIRDRSRNHILRTRFRFLALRCPNGNCTAGCQKESAQGTETTASGNADSMHLPVSEASSTESTENRRSHHDRGSFWESACSQFRKVRDRSTTSPIASSRGGVGAQGHQAGMVFLKRNPRGRRKAVGVSGESLQEGPHLPPDLRIARSAVTCFAEPTVRHPHALGCESLSAR